MNGPGRGNKQSSGEGLLCAFVLYGRLAFLPISENLKGFLQRDFALMEAPLALAMALQRYDFAPVDDRKVKPQLGSGLKPKSGVWAVVARFR